MDEYPKDFVTIGAVENVYTTHVVHQEQFYVHLDTRSSILEEIMDALELRYSQLGPDDKTLLQLKLGGLCAAKFTDDNNWYRVKITGLLNNGLIEVNFVDYGNTDYVGPDRVKKLDPDLMQYPVQSYSCALAGVSCKHGIWTPELRVQFEDLVVDKRCKAVFSGKTGEDIYLLDMYDEKGNYINKIFGATEKENVKEENKVNENGVPKGFNAVSWSEGQKVQALVVYVANPDLFWCQEVSHTNNIIILSEELSRLHMTQQMGPLRDVRPGSICAAKFSEDEAWYRGIIQSVSGNKSQVYFVDYGNTESVALDSLCELKEEFRHLPALGVKCALNSVNKDSGNKWSAKAIEQFEKLVVDKEFEVSVTRRRHDGYEVSLLDIEENKDIASQFKQLLSQGIPAQTPKAVNINNNSQSQPMGRGLDLPVGSICNAFICWVDNPADFWVQQESLSDILDQLTSELQEYYAQPRPMALSAPGAFVIARFSEDQQWYRGLVVKEFEDRVKVLFIDFGNADVLPKTELRQVNPQFGQIDPLAFRCCLKGVKPLPRDNNTWSADAKEVFEKLTENGCHCEVLSKNDSFRFVALNANGKDVAQELVAAAVVSGTQPLQVKPTAQSYAGSPRLQENQTEQALVTHIDSPNNFWVQLSKHHPQLDAVMEKLDSHYSEDGGTPVSKPTVGQACVAQFSLDNAWYRAVITNISPSGYNVQFVDYGNREVVAPSLVCVAEPRFLDLPSQAIKCRLSSTGDVSQFKDAFSDLVLEKDVTLKVTSVGEIPSVELVIEGQSVSTMLRNQGSNVRQSQSVGSVLSLKQANPIPQGSTINAFVSVVESPDKFFLQVAGIDEELNTQMDLLAQQYVSGNVPVISKPSVGMYCVALYTEDEQWYRGQIKSVQGSQCKVLFVDYGNEELVSDELIKAVTPEVSKTPILAYECSLHGVKADSWSESSISHFESLVMDQQLSCTFVSKSAVTIFCNGEDVAAKMISAGHCHPVGGAGPKSPLSVSTGQSVFGSRSPKSPGFGQSPKKDQSSPRGFGGNRREERSFGDSREDNKGFGGGRREKNGFGGGGEDDDGGFKPRSHGGDSGGFGKRDGDSSSFGDKGSGFGGGRRERNSSASSSTTADKFTYADPPSEAESAILVHIDDNGTFYLQLPSMEKDIVFLAKRLAGSYKSGGPRLKESATKGTICCCKFPDDGSMYRCQVEGVEGNKVLVRYMDFGNTAEHTTFDLKYLFPDLLQYPVQAFPCQLRGLEWSLDKADTFGVATLDKNLEVTFTSTSSPYQVDIKTPDGDLLAIMKGEIIPTPAKVPSTSQSSPGKSGGFGARSPSKGFGGGMDTSTPKKSDWTSSPPTPLIPKQIFITQTAPSESQSAFISHISEGHFYIQLEKDTALLDSLTEKLTKIDSSVSHPGLMEGTSCAAVFSEDSSWYRALVTKVEGDEFTVTFVDFGNGDKVSKQNICPLNKDLLSSAPLAYQCRFAGEDEPLSDVSKAKLEEYLMEHQITVSFSGQSAPFSVVVTTSDGQDLHEIVCPSNTFRSHVIPKEVTPVGVCHIEDDGRFFAIFFNKYKAKAKFQKCLQSHGGSSPEPLETPELDTPCCAKSLSDDLWHRCKIVSISDSKADILFVDIGKIENVEVSDLKVLPSEFLKEAPFALECRMKGVDSWTDNLREKFIDMTQDKILNATFHSTSPPFRVSLARSLELDLLGLNAPESPRKEINQSVIINATKDRPTVFQGGDSYITEIPSQEEFFVQLVAEEAQLQSLCDILETIMESDQNEPEDLEVGMMVCAKFTEDDVWYRATVETLEEGNKYSVRFVDYGNSDTVEIGRLSTLPEKLSTLSIPAFAYKCKLTEGISQLEEFKNAVLDKLVTTEVISQDEEGIFYVNVKIDGQAVISNQESEVFEAQTGSEQGGEANSKRTTVTVSFVISPSEYYVQLQSDEPQLDTMMNELYEELTSLAEGEGLVKDDVAMGDLCAALYEESWYRVKITDLAEDETVQVLFIDYGNTEMLSSKSELRKLSLKYVSLPLYGHKASLPGIKPVSEDWTEEAIEAFKTLVEEKSLLADLISTCDEPWVVQLLDMGTPVQDTLIAKGHGVATESVAISKTTQRVFSDANESVMVQAGENDQAGEVAQHWKNKIGCISDTLEELKQVTAFVSHSDSPSQVWCQLTSSTDDLEVLADKLDAVYTTIEDSDKVIGNLNADDLVIGLYEDDGMRYRSAVLNSGENDKVSLRFIDYGNCGSSTRDQILIVKEDLCQQPALAFCCCVDKIQPVDGEWSPEACSRLADLVADQELFLSMVGRKQDRTVLVDLIVQKTGKSISDILLEEGLAKKLEMDTSLPVKVGGGKGDVSECLEITQPIMESTAMVDETSPYSIVDAIDGYYRCIELSLHSSYDVLVSDDELPNAFCVQLKEMSSQYEALMKDIAEYIASDNCDDKSPKVGDPCLVLYESTWYRGLIRMDTNDGNWVVVSVDCGWEVGASREKVRCIPDEFLELPTQAIHCYLAGIVSQEPEWSSEAITFFIEYLDEERDHLHIDIQESADDGKYGVTMTNTPASSTDTPSLNHLFVEMAFAEIVPGSNIEVEFDMDKALDTNMLNELEQSFKEVELTKHNDMEETEVKEDSNMEDTPEKNVVSDDEISPEEMVEKDLIIEAIREESQWRQENLKPLSNEEEEKILLPYEYYETVENGIGNTVNGNDDVCSIECEENLRVINADNKAVFNGKEDVSSVKVDGVFDPGEAEKAVCSSCSESEEMLLVDNGQVENQGSEDDDMFVEEEGASYITLDETGFGKETNETGDLTDGYHGSASEEASSSMALERSSCLDREQGESVSLQVKDKSAVNGYDQKADKGETIDSSYLHDKKSNLVRMDHPCAVNESVSDRLDGNGCDNISEKRLPAEIECTTIANVSDCEKQIVLCEDEKIISPESQKLQCVELEGTKLIGQEEGNKLNCVKGWKAEGEKSNILVEDKEVIVEKDSFRSEDLKAIKDDGIAQDGEDGMHVSVVTVTGDTKTEESISNLCLESDPHAVNSSSKNSKEIDQGNVLTTDVTSEDSEGFADGVMEKNHDVLEVQDDLLSVEGVMSSSLQPVDQGASAMSSDEDDDELVAYVSTLDDTDTYESASENFEDFDRTDSFNSSNLVRELSERYLSTSEDSSFDQSGMNRSEADSSSYDTSSLLFSDSQHESSYADTSTSTQTTEISGLTTDTDTSAYRFDASSICEEDCMTHNSTTTSSTTDSMSSLVNAASKSLSLSPESNKEMTNSCSDVGVAEAGTEDQTAVNLIAVSSQENEVKGDIVLCGTTQEIVKDEVASVQPKDNSSMARNEELEVSTMIKIDTRTETLESPNDVENQSVAPVVGVDSEQSGPPSFHSVDDDDAIEVDEKTKKTALESNEVNVVEDEKDDSFDDAVDPEFDVQQVEVKDDCEADVGDEDTSKVTEKLDDSPSDNDQAEESTNSIKESPVSNQDTAVPNEDVTVSKEESAVPDEEIVSKEEIALPNEENTDSSEEILKESDSNLPCEEDEEPLEKKGVLLNEEKESESDGESESVA